MRREKSEPVSGGLFVTFEGTEGTGKSTQIRLLKEALIRAGRRVVATREPGGTRLGKGLRQILLGLEYRDISPAAELFLYLADRSQHLAEVIAPALEGDGVVLCDRFADATLAYQGYGRGLDLDFVRRVHLPSAGQKPDLTILLDLDDVGEGLRRSRGRHAREGTDGIEDRFEREEMEFHRRVRHGYLELAAAEPGRIKILPADLPASELHRKILELVQDIISVRSR